MAAVKVCTQTDVVTTQLRTECTKLLSDSNKSHVSQPVHFFTEIENKWRILLYICCSLSVSFYFFNKSIETGSIGAT